MFGGSFEPPKKPKKQPWPGKRPNISNQSASEPYVYSYNAVQPASNYNVQLLHYKQKLEAHYKNIAKNESEHTLRDKIFVLYHHHFEKKGFRKDVKNRVDAKLKAYEEQVDHRRERLLELLAKEEREYYYETVDQAQRGKETKLAEMKERAAFLKNKKEAERQQVVTEKRIQQYRERNEALRPILVTAHKLEATHGLLQQMRENEARRESEREIDMFYHNIMMRNVQEKIYREEQDGIKAGIDIKEMIDTWDKQVLGKKLLEEEANQVKQEDKEELIKICNQLKEDKLDAFSKELKKREERRKELREQIKIKKQFIEQREKESAAVDKAFDDLAKFELSREKDTTTENKIRAKRELLAYRNHLKELERENTIDEKETERLVEENRIAIQALEDEKKCIAKRAKQALQKEVLATRAEQIKENKERIEEERRQKEKLGELIRLSNKTDLELQREHEKHIKDGAFKYRDDLLKQISYNTLLRERQRQEELRDIKSAKEEDDKYISMINAMIKEKIETGTKHPFREVLEQYDCKCLEEMIKQL